MDQSLRIEDLAKVIYQKLNASAGAGTRKEMIIKIAILEYMLNNNLILTKKQ